jgi:hypothetical protein
MLLEKFMRKKIRAMEAHYQRYFDELNNKSPRAAASYVRNAFHIEMNQALPGVTERSVSYASGGEFNSVDEYINDSDTIETELLRRQDIMKLNALQESQIKR